MIFASMLQLDKHIFNRIDSQEGSNHSKLKITHLIQIFETFFHSLMLFELFTLLQFNQNYLEMTSLYFAASKDGYVKKTVENPQNYDRNRQLPVYKVVNEFMYGEPKEQDKSIIKQVDEEAELFEYQKSSRSLDAPFQKNVKYVMIKSTHTVQKSQNGSLIGDEMSTSEIKERENSWKETSASQIASTNRNNIKIGLISSQIHNKQESEDLFDRSSIQKEIQKEKTLRKNLQHSYYSLLNKIKQSTECQSERNEPQCKIIIKKPHNLSLSQTQENEIFLPKPEKRTRKPSRSKTQKSMRQEQKREEDLQIRYLDHLKDEKYFQAYLLEEIEDAQANIQELQRKILQRQDIIRHRQLLKINQADSSTKKALMTEKIASTSQQGLNHQKQEKYLHFIFTMFIVFLIAAMALKNNQK